MAPISTPAYAYSPTWTYGGFPYYVVPGPWGPIPNGQRSVSNPVPVEASPATLKADTLEKTAGESKPPMTEEPVPPTPQNEASEAPAKHSSGPAEAKATEPCENNNHHKRHSRLSWSGGNWLKVIKIVFDGLIVGGVFSFLYGYNPFFVIAPEILVGLGVAGLAKNIVEAQKPWSLKIHNGFRRVLGKPPLAPADEAGRRSSLKDKREMLPLLTSVLSGLGNFVTVAAAMLCEKLSGSKEPPLGIKPSKTGTWLNYWQRGTWEVRHWVRHFKPLKYIKERPALMLLFTLITGLVMGYAEGRLAQYMQKKALQSDSDAPSPKGSKLDVVSA